MPSIYFHSVASGGDSKKHEAQNLHEKEAMKVARNTTHGLRHDCLKVSDEKGSVEIRLTAYRNEIQIYVRIDGQEFEADQSVRRLAEVLIGRI